MTFGNILAFRVAAPLANAIHRLRALLHGALLKLVLVWASESIVCSGNRDLVRSASLVQVSIRLVSALRIAVPGSDTVNRLGTLLSGALLKIVLKRTGITTVGSSNRNSVCSALLVHVVFLVVLA